MKGGKEITEWLSDQMKRAVALRSKDREFHGLEREFLYIKAEMLSAYEKSKDVKHPRDVGSAREEILRSFLTESGYLPKRYAVSERSARVASTTGHVTGEMDIVLYDPLNSVRLMDREEVYEVYPVESVYGVVQVKSRLNRREIGEGLENIATFKALNKKAETGAGWKILDSTKSQRGFGVLFAYDTDLKWVDVVRETESVTKALPQHQWCNAVFILSKGLILLGDKAAVKFTNNQIETIKELLVHGRPDHDNTGVYSFYSILLTLLRQTTVQAAEPDSYFRLPLIADEYSYDFVFGAFAEVGTCPDHGDWQRKISAESLKTIVNYCRTTMPINWIKAIDLGYGQPGDNQAAYDRQPGDVRIYNPENLPLADILVAEDPGTGLRSLAFDQIQAGGMVIFLPWHYSLKEGLVASCPKCPPIVVPTDEGKANTAS